MTTTRTYKDIDLNFTKHPVTGDVAKKVDAAAIIASISNLLQTGKYERLWNPSLYSRLRAHLFEPMDAITASAISREIRTTIKNYEPRVNLTTVNVIPDYVGGHGYDVTLTFFVVNRADPITIDFFLERIR